jgi:serine protease inhibitor
MRKSLTALAAIAALGLLTASPPAQPAPLPVAVDRTEGELAAAQAKLAWALIERLANRNSATISPASLASAFAIVSLGSDATMKTAIAKALGFAPQRAEVGVAALANVRGKLAKSDAFRSAGRIVFAPASPPNKIMRTRLEDLGIDYAIADLSNPEAAAKIDAWVNEITKGAIPEILGGPVERASFVALNALHFKNRWKTPFDPQLTAAAPFRGIDGKTSDVAMMRLSPATRAFRQERHHGRNFVAIDLPFSDERFSLVVVTTTDRLASAKEFAPVAGWLAGAGFKLRSGDLALPRFSTSGREDLMPTLDTLGLDKARHAATALQGFAPGAMLSQVIQRATIEVDEEGAEAAAATAVTASRMLDNDETLHMVVDKPFVYALRDSATGLILVAGYMGQPPKGKTS